MQIISGHLDLTAKNKQESVLKENITQVLTFQIEGKYMYCAFFKLDKKK